MQNPWENLTNEKGLWVLPEDYDDISKFNRKKTRPVHRVCLESLPEPFIGNPESARLVLLGLNPGHSDADVANHETEVFKEAILLNLRHQLEDYPFYPLNPAFHHTGAGVWWGKRLRRLKEACGLSDRKLSERILVIEWFPYHSVSSGLPGDRICGSQQYGFDLAKKLSTKRNVIFLGMRAKSRWAEALGVGNVGNISFLHSFLNSYITPLNMRAGLFEQIVQILCESESDR